MATCDAAVNAGLSLRLWARLDSKVPVTPSQPHVKVSLLTTAVLALGSDCRGLSRIFEVADSPPECCDFNLSVVISILHDAVWIV